MPSRSDRGDHADLSSLEELWKEREASRQERFLEACREAVEARLGGQEAGETRLRRWCQEPASDRERAIASVACAAISVALRRSNEDRRRDLLAATEAWAASFWDKAAVADPGSRTERPLVQAQTLLRTIEESGERWRRSAAIGPLIAFFLGEEVEVSARTSVYVPYVDGRTVRVGSFTVELRPNGLGAHYFDPVVMPFFQPDPDFREAVDRAWRLARTVRGMSLQSDVVWSVPVGSAVPLSLAGSSVGLAAAVGFLRILRPGAREPDQTCYTGALDPALDGQVSSVSGYDMKVRVALSGWTLVHPAVDAERVRGAVIAELGPWPERSHHYVPVDRVF